MRSLAERFQQTFVDKFFDTYAPVAPFRVIYALSAYLNLFIESLDVDVAFLSGTFQ